MYRPILDNPEVTFVKAHTSNIYPIFRQEVPQNFWNLVIPPLSPFNVQNKVKLGENKITSTLFIQGELPPPPFGQCPKERRFFMASLCSLSKITIFWLNRGLSVYSDLYAPDFSKSTVNYLCCTKEVVIWHGYGMDILHSN